MYVLIPLLVWIDLSTKYFANIFLQDKISLISDILFFKYIENIGIAFSFPITGLPLKIMTVWILSYFIYYYFTQEKYKKNTLVDLSFIFILSWWLWNAYERIIYGKVIDFIWIKNFAIFNIADIFITLWVILYVIHIFQTTTTKKTLKN